jgi:hypothetical protein
VERDAEPDELDEPGGQRPGAAQRCSGGDVRGVGLRLVTQIPASVACTRAVASASAAAGVADVTGWIGS